MQCAIVALSALSIGSALAAPPTNVTSKPTDLVTVGLWHEAAESDTISLTIFKERHLPDSASPEQSYGPFDFVQLNLSSGVENKELRCQILDEFAEPIVLVRNGNVDITFSDQDKGAWILRDGEQDVFTVLCDPSFKSLNSPKTNSNSSSSSSFTTTRKSSTTSSAMKPSGWSGGYPSITKSWSDPSTFNSTLTKSTSSSSSKKSSSMSSPRANWTTSKATTSGSTSKSTSTSSCPASTIVVTSTITVSSKW
ncbi:uncharacterized protein SEPMUDRAFT_116813 [Sphaerulina musiva SO2202]|uniref:Uncharacterized protein n=1 Tax=Sphaerulina musiva (strain SO2202) TaxID=692275 RepID=M3D7E7_SPHMS|nr:uncharacterized protein SEPMUDRAFT_116813 [Sphaerulina musiva SO2202]EMF13799.1 hypothetical protein SEPMUDRAFT_116813 [Sphaerulina musiva SO2202]